MMISGWPASTATAGQSAGSAAVTSCHQWSRPAVQGSAPPVRRCTITWRTLGQAVTASSAVCFIGIAFPRRANASAVIRATAPQLDSRVATAWAPKPEKHGA